MLGDTGAVIGQIEEMRGQGKTLNWDITTFPSLKELPGVVQMDGPFLVAIYSQSKHKNEAMQVISAVTSDENELNVSRSGRLPSLKDKKFQENFGADLESLKEKNIKAVFMSKPADNPPASKYADLAESFLTGAVDKVLGGQVDANTALREAEDQANKKIDEEKK
jgi:multiple sugar transport system substrate-binding protein